MKKIITTIAIVLGSISVKSQEKLNIVKNINNVNIYNYSKFIDNGFELIRKEKDVYHFSNCTDTISLRFKSDNLVSVSISNENLAAVNGYKFIATSNNSIFYFINSDYCIAKVSLQDGKYKWVYYSEIYLYKMSHLFI